MPPVAFTMTLFPIAPSLQAAAADMTGHEFCALTEQARDHLLAGNNGELTSLLAGRKIEASREVLGQIALGRAAFFDEAVPAKLFAAIAELPTSRELQAEPKVLQNIADLESDRWERRQRAVKFFFSHRDPRAIEPLLQRLTDDGSETVRRTAAFVIGQIGDIRAVEPLLQALKDGKAVVREAAAMALGMIGDARAVEPLIQTLQDKDSWVSRAAAEALAKALRSRMQDA